jgi:hypothetical protein
MTRQQTTDLFLAAMHEHGPTFGVRLLTRFIEGAKIACESLGDREAAREAAMIVAALEDVALLTTKLEDML